MIPVMISSEFTDDSTLEDILFSRKRTKKAAVEFMEWLKSKGGRVSAAELSLYARHSSLSRVNFYSTMLRTYMNLGLIGKRPAMESTSGTVTTHYFAVPQPVTGRKPADPSIVSWAFRVGRKWNSYFFENESKSRHDHAQYFSTRG